MPDREHVIGIICLQKVLVTSGASIDEVTKAFSCWIFILNFVQSAMNVRSENYTSFLSSAISVQHERQSADDMHGSVNAGG